MASSDEEILHELEERLLQPGVRKSAEDLNALLADDFVEFGSSGRVFNKPQIIESLKHETKIARSLVDFRATQLAPDAYLVSYRVIRHGASKGQTVSTLRSSVWRRIDGRWQMIFHQGTRTASP